MKVLIFWDVYWRIWRRALKKELPKLKNQYKPDFIIANIENITSWRGPIEKHVLEIENLWVDVMTSWDHIFDNFKDVQEYLWKKDSKLIRAANFYHDNELEWFWYKLLEKNNKKLLVIHLLAETFMNHKVFNPFIKAEQILKKYDNKKLDWVIIDFHKETTSEGYWMAFHLDSKISFLYWTHTHVQTNDDLILEWWTWIISDIWMNWPLYWVIWASYDSVKNRFLTWVWKWKIQQCLDKNYIISWVFVEIGENMNCVDIEKIRVKWIL